MDFLFRADAGTNMGIGHVMRCLTLADMATSRGHRCRFVCREQPGHMIDAIDSRGYSVAVLARKISGPEWLGASEDEDAAETLALLAQTPSHWVVTDNYAIGAIWERKFRQRGAKVLAIDDLADRSHDCNILLDQTLGRAATDYASWVPADALVLAGASMALLRPSFAAARANVRPRVSHTVSKLLISLGGSDAANLTSVVIEAINRVQWPSPIAVDVVLGGTNPWYDVVAARAARSSCPMQVHVNLADMVSPMIAADLAIGTAGTTSWERCCLGLPSIMVVAADNQRKIAQALAGAGAAITLDVSDGLTEDLVDELTDLANQPSRLLAMSERAATLVDGLGCERVLAAMENMS